MERHIEDFITALRDSGVRISTSESIDAVNAVKIIGYHEREVLKYSLSSTLAKSLAEKELFNQCFDLFFSLASFNLSTEDYSSLNEALKPELSPLTQKIIDGDQLALITAIREAGQAVKINEMKFVTQQGLYINKIMEQIGFEALAQDIQRFLQGNLPGGQQMGVALNNSRDNLMQYIINYVEQQYTLYSSSQIKGIIEKNIKKTRFSDLDQRHIAEMGKIINKMAKHLYALHSRRLKNNKKGRLDVRRTIRKNSAYHGFLFIPQWKAKKIDRPEVFVICDVSRSVINVAHFMLLFVYSLNTTLAKVRTFVLCSNLVETSQLFAKYSAKIALEKISQGEEIDISLGLTDYGQALLDFKRIALNNVTNKTTVIFLGDARNNGGDPQARIMQEIYGKCKKLIWLNPEHPRIWTSGDSEMKSYLPYCHIAEECNTLNHLDKILNRLFAH